MEKRLYHLTKDQKIPAGSILITEGDWALPAEISRVRDPELFARMYSEHVLGLVASRRVDLKARLSGRTISCSCPGPRSARCPGRILLELLDKHAGGRGP